MLRKPMRQGPIGLHGNQTGRKEKGKARTMAKEKTAKLPGKATTRLSLHGIARTLLAMPRITTPTLGGVVFAGPSAPQTRKQLS